MTVIAAMCSSLNASTWVASDTLISSGNLQLYVGPKWVMRGSWAVGIAGHMRTINIFQNHADELLRDLRDAYEFSRRARQMLLADGYLSAKNDEGPSDLGQMMMLANPRSAWTVGADFSLTQLPVDTLWAEGSGRELAIGAAHALQATCAGISAKEIIRAAVETAIARDIRCGGTAWIAELPAGADATA
jgi:ATP-dependent protease HslVU (ClpYQ) peptidase subunit